MVKLVKVLTGSRLYGTYREDSDFDFRGIHIPSLRDCYLGKIQDVINAGPEELYYSIHKFLDLCETGQPVALEMLFAPNTHTEVENLAIWQKLHSYRNEFLNKKMEAYLGFGKSLANKYAVKADRLKALNQLIDFISLSPIAFRMPQFPRLSDLWEHLPLNEFCQKETDAENRIFYTVLSRKYRDNTTLTDFVTALDLIREDYGQRVKAAESGLFDSKSVSHCFRICYQLQDMVKYGEFIFPLKQVGFLRKLKNKEVDYQRDDIFGQLDAEIKMTEQILAGSSLRESIREGIKEEILDFIYRMA